MGREDPIELFKTRSTILLTVSNLSYTHGLLIFKGIKIKITLTNYSKQNQTVLQYELH